MAAFGLQVDTIAMRSLQKALKAADPDLQKQLRRELKGAAEMVASTARGKVPSDTGRAARGIKSGATTKGAYVVSGRGVPYGAWLDFGSRNPRSGRSRSVGPWAGSGSGPKGGRFVYPALDERFDEVLDSVRKAVSKSIDSLF